jgi:hypothetical protein
MLSPEQFQALLAEIRKPSLNRPKVKTFGMGCVGDGGPLDAGVYSMLAAGSPRLALAKALGVPLAPYTINCRATFPDTSTSVVPDVGSDIKITQDTLIDAVRYRVTNLSTTANQNQFQAQTDFFFGLQSGIEVLVEVVGAPRYDWVSKYTPLANLADLFNGNSHWPGGWVLTYQQQIKMDFQAKVALPYAPIEVVVTFNAWQPVTGMFVTMSNREACAQLAALGIDLSDQYVTMVTSQL